MDAISLRYLIFIYALTHNYYIEAAKILLAPFPYSSHVAQHIVIGTELIANGHQVKIMLSASYPGKMTFKKENSNIQVLEYATKNDDLYTLSGVDNPMAPENVIGVPPIDDFRINVDGFAAYCYNSLEDEALFEEIKQEHFDLAIVGAFPCTRCYYILFYRLGIPYISHTTYLEPWLLCNPSFPSFVPFIMSSPAKSQEMTLLERIHNSFQLIDWSVFPRIPYLHDSLVSKYAPEMPVVSLDWLAGQSLLWLIDTDTAIDYPRAMMPNEIHVGGLLTKPAKPLTGDFNQIMNNATDGVIVASFGSFDVMTEDILAKFLTAFSKIPPTVSHHK